MTTRMRTRAHRRANHRRGVSSVLAMMFLVLFGSLAAAMAVVAQGNLRTADSSLRVSRAMSAAETGLVFASRRLEEQASRFVVTRGVLDAAFVESLWKGTIDPADVEVLDPDGYVEPVPPSGIMQALEYVYGTVDTHSIVVESDDVNLPSSDTVTGVLEVRPIALGDAADPPYFRVRYELLDTEPGVRISVTGFDGEISRRLQMDFLLRKQIEFAVLSPNRIMIGKNVLVEGPLGSLYGIDDLRNPNPDELDLPNGDPMVLRSDFYDLDPDLDLTLDAFYAAVADYDQDGDSRLRPAHPDEGPGLVGNPDLVDVNGDEYVDDFDLFLATFDGNTDGRVVYDEDLALAAGFSGLSNEYGDVLGEDGQLMRLIDLARPDRDGDGVKESPSDIALGWSDGLVDSRDLYAKVHGRLAFGVARSDWEFYHGESYQTVVQGPIRAGIDVPPASFAVEEDEMLELETNMFTTNASWYESQVPPSPVPDLVDPPQDPALLANEAITPGTYHPPGSPPAGMDVWEGVPFGSPGAYDYYMRPVYENMTFENVRIPRGNNGLFINCIFLGVTWIETVSAQDTEGYWNYTGAVGWVDANLNGIREPSEFFTPRFTDPADPSQPMTSELPNGTRTDNTRDYSNNVRFHDCTFLGSVAGDRIGTGLDTDYTYTHWRTKVQMTGDTRFYLETDDPDLLADPNSGTYIPLLETLTAAELEELRKSSILLPGWSVDVGSFDHDAPIVKLKGTIVAGVFDVRGRADVHGTLLMTFRPRRGEGPLLVMGSINVDKFNTTIGYFSDADGDDEGEEPQPGEYGEIRLRYDPDALLPDGIPWPIAVEPMDNSYVEGGV